MEIPWFFLRIMRISRIEMWGNFGLFEWAGQTSEVLKTSEVFTKTPTTQPPNSIQKKFLI